jgi:hypothetical protein
MVSQIMLHNRKHIQQADKEMLYYLCRFGAKPVVDFTEIRNELSIRTIRSKAHIQL